MTGDVERWAAGCLLASFPGHRAPDWIRRWLERGLGGAGDAPEILLQDLLANRRMADRDGEIHRNRLAATLFEPRTDGPGRVAIGAEQHRRNPLRDLRRRQRITIQAFGGMIMDVDEAGCEHQPLGVDHFIARRGLEVADRTDPVVCNPYAFPAQRRSGAVRHLCVDNDRARKSDQECVHGRQVCHGLAKVWMHSQLQPVAPVACRRHAALRVLGQRLHQLDPIAERIEHVHAIPALDTVGRNDLMTFAA